MAKQPSEPAAPQSDPAPRQKGGLREFVDRMLSGSPESDPLYLSNRTFFQKARLWILVGIPCLVGLGVVAWVFTRPAPKAAPPKEVDRAEMARNLAPELNTLKIAPNTQIQILTAQVNREKGVRLIGTLKNISGRPITSADVVFDLTDKDGSQLGAVSVTVSNVAAGATADFSVPLIQDTAVSALVREAHAQ
jgi:hypothetical protein